MIRFFLCLNVGVTLLGASMANGQETPPTSKPAIETRPAMSASQMASNKAAVLEFYDAALNRKDFTAASRFIGPAYKQHNPRASDGLDGFRLFIENMKANLPRSHSEIKQAFVDGDYVILHVHKTPEPNDRGVSIIDIFRLSKGKIVEHWDVTQEIPEHTVSGNSMF